MRHGKAQPDELVENAAESGDKKEDEVPDQEPVTSIGRSHCDPRGIRENTSVERMMERGKLGWTTCGPLRCGYDDSCALETVGGVLAPDLSLSTPERQSAHCTHPEFQREQGQGSTVGPTPLSTV